MTSKNKMRTQKREGALGRGNCPDGRNFSNGPKQKSAGPRRLKKEKKPILGEGHEKKKRAHHLYLGEGVKKEVGISRN